MFFNRSKKRKKSYSFQDFLSSLSVADSRDIAGNEYKLHSWVYAAINKIATNIAGVPVQVLDAAGNEHEQWKKLFARPNAYQVWYEMCQYITINLEINGEIFLVLDDMQSISDVPAAIYPVLATSLQQKDGVWILQTQDGKVRLAPWQVARIYYADPADYTQCLSPITAARTGIRQDYKASLYNEAFFENGAFPGAILKYERHLNDEEFQRVKREWKDRHGGIGKSFGVGILEGNVEFEPISIPHKDAEFLEQRKYNRDEILAIFGVPKAVLGVYEDVNYATLLGAKRMFWQETLLPKMRLIAGSISSKILTAHQLEFRFDVSSISDLQDTFSEKIEWATSLSELGYPANMINERLQLGMPELPWGDDVLVNPMQVPVDVLTSPMDKSIRQKDYIETYVKLLTKYEVPFRKQYNSILYKQRNAVLSAAKKIDQDMPARVSDAMVEYSDQLIDLTIAHNKRCIQLSAEDSAEELGIRLRKEVSMVFDIAIDPAVLEFLEKKRVLIVWVSDRYREQVREWARKITYESLQGIESNHALAEKFEGTIKDLYAGWRTGHSLTVARTETAQAFAMPRTRMMQQAGVKRHTWLTAGDEAVRDSHQALQGVAVEIGKPFPEVDIPYPSYVGGRAEEVINCRCTTVPALDGE